jgi:hypothetical protein
MTKINGTKTQSVKKAPVLKVKTFVKAGGLGTGNHNRALQR